MIYRDKADCEGCEHLTEQETVEGESYSECGAVKCPLIIQDQARASAIADLRCETCKYAIPETDSHVGLGWHCNNLGGWFRKEFGCVLWEKRRSE